VIKNLGEGWVWWLTPNPSSTGDRDQENCSSRPAQVKNLKDPISINEAHVLACTCSPSYVGGTVGGLWSEFGPRKKIQGYLKNNQSKKGLRVQLK
jgi:hypothetical protein